MQRSTSSAAPSSSSRRNLAASNWAKIWVAVSYTTEKPFSLTTRAMQAERKVLPRPGRPDSSRLPLRGPNWWA